MALTMLSLTPDGVDPAFLSDRSEYAHRFLSGSQLAAFAHDPVNEMPEDFVSRALAKGDRCYAILDGETLASYGWYARAETPVTEDLTSLKSCYRMGYAKAGTIVALKLMGRYFIRVSRGCEPLGLGLRPVDAAPAAPRGPRRSGG